MPARRALAVLVAICAPLALQSLPAASAAKNAATGSTTAGADEATPQATRRAERAAARAEGGSPPPAPAPPALEPPAAAALHGHHAALAPTMPAAAGQGQQGSATGSRKGEHGDSSSSAHAHNQRREERRAASTSSAAGATTGSAVAAPSGEADPGLVEAFARKQKKDKNSGGGQKGKKERKEKGKKSGDPPPQEAGSGQEGSEGANGATLKGKGDLTAGTSSQASAASFTLPATAPAGGTGSASINSALPAANGGLAGGSGADAANKRHRAGHRRKAASRAAGAATAAAAGSALPFAAPSSQSSAPGSGGLARPRPKRTHPQSTQPELVKTFTRIVGVVPTPVWILIGALILLALLLGARSLLSGVRARRLERQRGQLLEDVGLLQAALLPEPPSRLGPVATSAAYRPADGPGAGGDFYDVFALGDGEIAVVVGDVSGHGREALPHTALLRFTVRAYLEAGLSPRKALQTAGGVLERQLSDSFATVIAATYNPRERTLTYASAGHPPPIVLGQGDRPAIAPVTSCSAPPIGAGMRTGTRQTVVSIPGPARLCFHTDGVTEARIAGELFGAERLAEELGELPREANATALLERVAERSDARPDDMAACLLRVHDGHGAPAIALEQLELDRELVAGSRLERFLFDWGVPPAEIRALVRDARARLRHADTVLLELIPVADGRATATLLQDNVIHPAALAAARA